MQQNEGLYRVIFEEHKSFCCLYDYASTWKKLFYLENLATQHILGQKVFMYLFKKGNLFLHTSYDQKTYIKFHCAKKKRSERSLSR